MSLFEQSPKEEKKKSLFDAAWRPSEGGEEQEERFSSVSVPAVLAMIGGVFSVLVFFSPVFLFIPCCTFPLALWALWSISRSDGMLTGVRFARIGLFLLIFSPTAALVNDIVYQTQLLRQAKTYFRSVFDDIQHGDLLAVRQSMLPYFARPTDLTEAAYWKSQMGKEEDHELFHSDFLSNPTLLTLYTLGERAKYSYYKTESIIAAPNFGTDRVKMVFAVTYPGKDGGNETFFIPVVAIRTHDTEKKRAGWGRQKFEFAPLPADYQ